MAFITATPAGEPSPKNGSDQFTMGPEQPWIGFVHVQPTGEENPFGDGIKGAYAHVLALADGSEAYRNRTCSALEEEGLLVIEVRDVAPVTAYRAEGRISEDMDELISALSDAHPVQFDIFDAYEEHDA